MGAYFRVQKNKGIVTKILIKKKNGSPYPSIEDFNKKISLLKKYLGDFIADSSVTFDGKSIRVEQPEIHGEDIFVYLRGKSPARFSQFVQSLDNLYRETEILPDLINDRNILVTKNNQIKVVDIWPLFFRERVESGDLNEQSYRENLERFALFKTKASP